MHSNRLLVLVLLVVVSGCAKQGIQLQHIQSTTGPVHTTRTLTIHGTTIVYRDLSRPSQQVSVQSLPTQIRTEQSTIATIDNSQSEKTNKLRDTTVVLSSKKQSSATISGKQTGDDQLVSVLSSVSESNAETKRIMLSSGQSKSGTYQKTHRSNKRAEPKRRATGTQEVGLWQWLFGKRKAKPVEKTVPRPDAELLDRPTEVLFKHAKTDQLEDGQLDRLLALSSQANTTAIYEVRGTAGFKGKKAQRLGRERAAFIKQTLMNAGVSRTKIRIMAYDASYPGLRGVVTLRDGKAI